MEVALLSVQNIFCSPTQDLRFTRNRPICEIQSSYSPPWRPWIMTSRDLVRQWCRRQHSSHLAQANAGFIGATLHSLFTHPVRLMWPKNKCFDYLYSEGQELLAAFPVQATITFYTESDSEEEEGESEEENESEEEPVMAEEYFERKEMSVDRLRHSDIIY